MSAISQSTVPVYPRLEQDKGKEPPEEDNQSFFTVNVEFTEFDPDKNTIVMLHGYLGSADDFEPAFERYHNDFNIIAIDLRGHGSSTSPTSPNAGWTMEDLANDIIQVVRLTIPKNTKFSLLASSMSTGIALEMARIHSKHIQDLYLISPTSKFSIPGWLKIVLGIGKFTPMKIVESFMDSITTLIPKFASEDEKKFWEEGVEKFKKIGLEIHKKIFQITLGQWEADLEGITQPVFVIAGLQDNVVPYDDTLALVEELPNASLLTLDFAEHHIIRKQQKIVYDLLYQWKHDQSSILRQKYYTNGDLVMKKGNYHLPVKKDYLQEHADPLGHSHNVEDAKT